MESSSKPGCGTCWRAVASKRAWSRRCRGSRRRKPRYGRYAALARAPREERRHGIQVVHPRYLSVPKVGMSVAPLLLAAGAQTAVAGVTQRGYDFDLIDAHYFYPDGVAAAIMGCSLNKPVVITARGTDVNLLPRFAVPPQDDPVGGQARGGAGHGQRRVEDGADATGRRRRQDLRAAKRRRYPAVSSRSIARSSARAWGSPGPCC